MRVALVFALALLLLIASMAFGFPGQQFFDDSIQGLELNPDDRCNCGTEDPELQYEEEDNYETV